MKWIIAVLVHCVFGALAFANTPGQHNITLTWDVDPACLAGCAYNVYRVTGTGDPCVGQPAPLGSSSINSYVDTPVAAGQTYSYRVTEVLLIGGESACSTGAQPSVSNQMGKTPTGLQGTGH